MFKGTYPFTGWAYFSGKRRSHFKLDVTAGHVNDTIANITTATADHT